MFFRRQVPADSPFALRQGLFVSAGYNARSSIHLPTMKFRRFFIVPVCTFCRSLAATPSFAGKIGRDCTFRGKKLYAKVQVVDAFPDFRIRLVSAFPDMKVQRVDAFASSCGRRERVDAFPGVP